MLSEVVLAGAPDEIIRIQEALAAPSRLAILRLLLERPQTFQQLSAQLELSATGLRNGLDDLAALGYVSDDSPAGRQRKSRTATFGADRERVFRDLAELTLYLAV